MILPCNWSVEAAHDKATVMARLAACVVEGWKTTPTRCLARTAVDMRAQGPQLRQPGLVQGIASTSQHSRMRVATREAGGPRGVCLPFHCHDLS
jgi:hypothetical protein